MQRGLHTKPKTYNHEKRPAYMQRDVTCEKHTHTHTHTHAHTRTLSLSHTLTYTSMHTHAHTHTLSLSHTHSYTRTHIRNEPYINAQRPRYMKRDLHT